MEILQPQPSDLIEIVYLQRVCFSEMKMRGWLPFELYKEFSLEDLKNTFILKQNSLTLGLIKIDLNGNDHQHEVNWNSTSVNPLIIDKLIIHPNWWNKNTGDQLMKFAEDYARKNGFTSIQLSSFSQNQQEIILFKQLSFRQTGEFHSRYQKIPYYCFEKLL